MNESTGCRNCGSVADGNYCGACGQRIAIERPTLRNLSAEFLQTVFLVESKLIRTFRDLVRRPGHTVQDYLRGRRAPYVAPIQFFLFAITLYLVVIHFFGSAMLAYFAGSSEPGQVISARSAMQYVSHNANVFGFLQAPILAFWLWLGMRRSGTNFAEALILSFYLVAVSAFFMGTLILLSHVSGKFMYLRGLIVLVYYPWAGMQFTARKSVGKFTTFMALSLAAYLTFIVVVTGVTLVYFLSQ